MSIGAKAITSEFSFAIAAFPEYPTVLTNVSFRKVAAQQCKVCSMTGFGPKLPRECNLPQRGWPETVSGFPLRFGDGIASI